MHKDTSPSPADPIVEPPRHWRPSFVWILPVIAALVGLSLVAHSWLGRGPTITVSFSSAEGIEAGKTQIKYKDVDIGEATAVHLADDRKRVLVTIELKKEAESFAAEDSRFWVVRPRLAGTGVSGLETLLSGSYIGVDGGHSEKRATEFTGLEDPPVVAADVPGRRYTLTASDLGSLDVGSPVFFRRIPVGHVERVTLSKDGRGLILGVFVKSPYDRFVTENTRFWHASGLNVEVGADGLKVNTQSLAAILMGGIAFVTPDETPDSPEAQSGREFALASDHEAAMKNPEGETLPVVLRFHQSIRGLAVGAPVDFRGMVVGDVASIHMERDPVVGDFTPVVKINLFPDRLETVDAGAPDKLRNPAIRKRHLTALVNHGLRAQLQSANMVTGQLFVALDFFPNAEPAKFNVEADPPELPTMSGGFQELYQQVQAILTKLDKIPFEAIGQDTHKTLVTLDATLKRLDGFVARADGELLPELRDSLKEMRASMETLQTSMAGDSPLQQDTRQALRGVTEATKSLKRLTDTIERQPESLLRGRQE